MSIDLLSQEKLLNLTLNLSRLMIANGDYGNKCLSV